MSQILGLSRSPSLCLVSALAAASLPGHFALLFAHTHSHAVLLLPVNLSVCVCVSGGLRRGRAEPQLECAGGGEGRRAVSGRVGRTGGEARAQGGVRGKEKERRVREVPQRADGARDEAHPDPGE